MSQAAPRSIAVLSKEDCKSFAYDVLADIQDYCIANKERYMAWLSLQTDDPEAMAEYRAYLQKAVHAND